jgi:hypothetical protein
MPSRISSVSPRAIPSTSEVMRPNPATATRCGTMVGRTFRASAVVIRVEGAANAKPISWESGRLSVLGPLGPGTTAWKPPRAQGPALSPWPSRAVAQAKAPS